MREVEEDRPGPCLSSPGAYSAAVRYRGDCAAVRYTSVSTHGKVYEPFCDEVAQLVTETTREISRAQPLLECVIEH